MACKNASTYAATTRTLKTDSFDTVKGILTGNVKAVKMNSGDDLVIQATLLSKFVVFEKAADEEDDYTSSGGSNTFVFRDMTNYWARNEVMSMYNQA